MLSVTVEASGYGDPDADGELLLAALDAGPLSAMGGAVAVDDARDMLLVTFSLDVDDGQAVSAAHEALALWEEVWAAAFDGRGEPARFALKLVPAAVGARGG